MNAYSAALQKAAEKIMKQYAEYERKYAMNCARCAKNIHNMQLNMQNNMEQYIQYATYANKIFCIFKYLNI